jgi:hypothetical protein
MSDLYIANCTQQTYTFHYRIPESVSPWQAEIRAGAQVKLPAPAGGFDAAQRDYVVEQLRRYGCLEMGEAISGRKRVWLIWSDRVISAATMYKVIEQNQNVLRVEGEGLRKEAAIAIDAQVSTMGENIGFTPPDAIEVSVVEEETKSNPSPAFSEGLRVSKTEIPGATPPRGSRRAGRQRAA